MNYYIKGDAANADRIKAAFEARGCVMHTGIQCDLSDMIYYSLKGKVGSIKLRNLDLFKTHPDYKELELPKPEFKVGDWVVKKDGTAFYGGNYAEQVTLIEGDEYLKCIWLSSTSWVRDNDIRFWTIQDVKDGDVICTPNNNLFIYKCKGSGVQIYDYCGLYYGEFEPDSSSPNGAYNSCDGYVPATKEQRDLLFSKMKEAGYQWDADKKELRKIKPHYDISNFNPFQEVLVRCGNDEEWMIEFYCKYDTLVHTSPHRDYPFMGIGDSYSQCIPYNDDTKHLLGTSDPCDEQYINW